MSRAYKNIRPQKHYVYTVDDLVRLYAVHPNTVSNWVSEGLHPSDAALPYMFNGSETKRFHDARRLKSKTKLRTGEFKCFGCKNRVFPETNSMTDNVSRNGFLSVWGVCPMCKCVVNKRVNETDWEKIRLCCHTNTTLASLDERYDPVPVGIVKDEPSEMAIVPTGNDRVLYDWLKFAGRWDRKTISAKLASIRHFEIFLQGKAFEKVTTADVNSFREHLKASVETSGDGQRSISTVRHCASHLKSFFEWLVVQKGYQGLNKSLPGHFNLPKKFEANGLGRDDRAVPNDEEAIAMVTGMATDTPKLRRDRAMVAIAFLAALRADTITSLRLKHIEISNRAIIQDARVSRTKNGKSLRINWFPLPPIFAEVVEAWLDELSVQGLREDDALFPDERSLQQRHASSQKGKVPVMTSTHAVTLAFRTASKGIGRKFSPHSAKHYIGALGLKTCKTVEEQAAWSANMGHEGMEITRRYYQKLPQGHVDDVFERLNLGAGSEVSIDDMKLMLRYHEHNLVKGTPEFERAKELVQDHAANGTFE